MIHSHGITASNVGERSCGCVCPLPLCVYFYLELGGREQGVFVAVGSKMRRCSPRASESVFVLLLNRILWPQQR